MKKTFLFLIAAATLCACSQKPAETATQSTGKSLILYYSQTNATRQVAQLLQQKTGADIDSIVAQQPYNGDFNETIIRCQKEFADSIAPEIKPLSHNIAEYDTIYLGYPVWFGTYAQPVAGLIKSVDLSGKVIIPFCTFGSGGLRTSTSRLATALPQAKLLQGFGIRGARTEAASAELDQFLIRIGVKPGSLQKLPDYGEERKITDADMKVFDAACGSYPMPLGTPVTVCTRETDTATDYEFVTESTTPDGQPMHTRICISVSKAEGAIPEFIEAIR